MQMAAILDDVTDMEINLIDLEGDVNFLFDEAVIQHERIFSWRRRLEESKRMSKAN